MLGIIAGIILGLLVGSFLNVVIYRLPVMMDREWRRQCRELLRAEDAHGEEADSAGSAQGEAPTPETFNLITPRSRCPSCGTQIKSWQNIPILSWLILRGKCGACACAIPARYPIIELITGVLSGLVIWHFGVGLAGGATLLFLWLLIALTVIDIDHQLLPDNLTYMLLWSGLGYAALSSAYSYELPAPDLQSSVLGAIAGYLSLWSVYWLFKLVTGKEGMGYGDFKLLAALGAWLGYQLLPVVILLSAAVGSIVGIGMIVVMGRDRQIPIPFGPYLAGAGFIALFWGETIVAAYLEYAGL